MPFRVSMFFTAALTAALVFFAQPALSGCPAGGFHISADITDPGSTDNPSVVKVSTATTTVSPPDNCWVGGPTPSWSFNLTLSNISNTASRSTPVRFDSMEIKLYDSSNTYLGSQTVAQADWDEWFTTGDWSHGSHSQHYILDPEDYCTACLCANFAGANSGKISIVANYKLPDSSGGPFTSAMPGGRALTGFQPSEYMKKAMAQGAPLPAVAPRNSLPVRLDGQPWEKAGGGHSISNTTHYVGYTPYYDGVALNSGETDTYEIQNMPANATNLSGTLTFSGGGWMGLYLDENGNPVYESAPSAFSPKTYTKASPNSEALYEWRVSCAMSACSDAAFDVSWDIPQLSCNSSLDSQNFSAEKDYHFKYLTSAGYDMVHFAITQVPAGADTMITGYSGYPNTVSDDCSQSCANGSDCYCWVAPAGATNRWGKISTLSSGTMDVKLGCYNKSTSPALSDGVTQANVTVKQGLWTFYKISAPAGTDELSVELTGVDSGKIVTLYTRKDNLPTPDTYTCRQSATGPANAQCGHPPNFGTGTWYIGVFGNDLGGSDINVDLKATLHHTPTQLAKNTPAAYSLAAGASKQYYLESGGAFDWLKVRGYGFSGSGNSAFYLKKGSEAGSGDYDVKNDSAGGDAKGMVLGQVENATYYVGITETGGDNSSNGSVVANWGDAAALAFGQSTNVMLSREDSGFYKVQVGSGVTSLGASQSCDDCNFNLKLYQGAITGAPGCDQTGVAVNCDINSPTAGDWFVVLTGKSSQNMGKLIVVPYGTSGDLSSSKVTLSQ